jgi:hypothetical protein
MQIVQIVTGVLADSSARVEERGALWTDLATTFEKNGGSAATQMLAERANLLKSRFDSTLRELGKKL